jgi:hypothetical protein
LSRFVQITDFEAGKLQISTTCYTDGTLQLCIDQTEEKTLQDLLGCELYALFVADWDAPIVGEFSEQRFIDIYTPFCEDGNICNIKRSEGVKSMLMNYIFFEYMRVQAFNNRTTGMNKTKSENSERAHFNEYGLDAIYNNGVLTFEAIRWYICENSSTYPEYEGIKNDLTSWL